MLEHPWTSGAQLRSEVLNLRSVQPESSFREQCCSKRGLVPVHELSIPCPRGDKENESKSKHLKTFIATAVIFYCLL